MRVRTTTMRIAAAVLLGLLPAVAARAQEESPLTAEDEADLAWFESLGYPKVGDRPFVEVGQPPRWTERGFLLEDDGKQVRILCLDLRERVYAHTPPGTPADQRFVVTPIRPGDAAETFLDGGEAPSGFQDRFERPAPIATRTRSFVFAAMRPFGRHGDHALHAVLAHVRTMAPGHHQTPPEGPFRAFVAEDLAAAEMFHLKSDILGAGDSWVSKAPKLPTWPEALERARRILERFPETSIGSVAEEMVAVMEAMVRDSEERAARQGPAGEPTPEERIDELVFRLREQGQSGFGTNGSRGEVAGGTADELIAIGLPAVPRLIEALADRSFTRCGYGPDRGGVRVWRVGDVALDLLVSIAGHHFTLPEGTTREEQWDMVTLRTRTEIYQPVVRAWWEKVQEEGTVPDLVRAVEAGGWGAVEAARALLDRDADAGLRALLVGVTAAADPGARPRLLDMVAAIPGEETTEALRRAMEIEEPWTRMAAAKHLLDRGDAGAVQVLLAMWKERRDGGGPPTKDPAGSSFWYRKDEFRQIAGMLLPLRDPDVLAELGANLPGQCVTARKELVRALAKARAGKPGDEWTDTVDGLLASVLTDRNEFGDSYDRTRKAAGFGLRVKDVAAATLAARYLFDVKADRDEPVYKRDIVANTAAGSWAKEHGLEPPDLPASGLPEWPEADPAPVADLLAAVSATTYYTDEYRAALARVEGLGLRELAELRRLLPEMKSPHNRDVIRIVGELAFTVRVVRMDPPDLAIPAELRARFEALTGTILSAPPLDDLVWDLYRATGKDLPGVSLDIYRGPDLHTDEGVIVTLQAQDGPGNGGWGIGEHALFGDMYVEAPDAHSGWTSRLRRQGGFRRMVSEALAAPPGERVWIHVWVQRRGP